MQKNLHTQRELLTQSLSPFVPWLRFSYPSVSMSVEQIKRDHYEHIKYLCPRQWRRIFLTLHEEHGTIKGKKANNYSAQEVWNVFVIKRKSRDSNCNHI